MAIGDSVTNPADAGPDSSGPPPSPAGPAGPPPGGGPMLAALAQRRQQPQVSVPGAGDTASSMSQITNAIGLIQQALAGLPPGSPIHKDALRAVTSLSRHLGQGQPTAGVQQTQLKDLLQGTLRNAMLANVMRQQGGQGGEPQQGPPGAMPSPMPSTPLPGA